MPAVTAPLERRAMSTNTNDSKGMGKMKTANKQSKPAVAKGRAAPVVKIPTPSARRSGEKPAGKEGKSSPPPAGDAAAALPKRKLGLRGAAPWAARHAAKHAAEARARAAEPPPPGSARATIRTPEGVEDIKAQIVQLHNDLEQIKALRKNLAKNFFDIGTLLRSVQAKKTYAAKGYQSFESFLER